jgi:hypothetical protein
MYLWVKKPRAPLLVPLHFRALSLRMHEEWRLETTAGRKILGRKNILSSFKRIGATMESSLLG